MEEQKNNVAKTADMKEYKRAYYQTHRDDLLNRAKERQKAYYKENREAIIERALKKYHKQQEGKEKRKRGRKAGVLFPDGYKKTPKEPENQGALLSPEADDLIFEELAGLKI
jgi:hypothetical protein